MRTSVVAHRDAAPVFEFAEHALNEVPVAIPQLIVSDRRIAALSPRDSGFDAQTFWACAKPVAVVASNRNQNIGFQQSRQNRCCAFVVTHLAFGE